MCFPAVINAAHVLHARSKGYLTLVGRHPGPPRSGSPFANKLFLSFLLLLLLLLLSLSLSLSLSRGGVTRQGGVLTDLQSLLDCQ